MDKIEGVIEKILYENKANGYTVCDVDADGRLVTFTGYMPDAAVGEKICAHGEWTYHAEYGEQFKVSYSEKYMPESEEDIEKYLASGIYPGIGKVMAERLVEKFGCDIFIIIENECERLAEIKGLSKKKALLIHEKHVEQSGMRDIVIFFQKLGISPSYAAKAYKAFSSNAVTLITQNPYILTDHIEGISFTTADRVASQLGFDNNNPLRLEGGLKYILYKAAVSSGHTFIPRDALLTALIEFLQIPQEDAKTALDSCLMKKLVVSEGDSVYLWYYYEAENRVAAKLRELSQITFDMNPAEVTSALAEVERESDIRLAREQVEAVKYSYTQSVTVITGGPGTGKTTIIKAIIRIMNIFNKSVVLAAPTGRAAKRMADLCGVEAKTIHRLLEVGYSDENSRQQFFRNEDNPISADVIIIDETSMVDILLMDSLLKAAVRGTRLIFVGDVSQLPSVGAGNVLCDIIKSGCIRTIALTEIFRQAKESMIVINAHRINNGHMPYLNKKDSDFFLVNRDGATDVSETIAELVNNRLPNFYQTDRRNIQVLTPVKKGVIGTDNLNAALQRLLNPESTKKTQRISRHMTFRTGDKVMQIKNNYSIEWYKHDSPMDTGTGVFNGDIGFITEINNEASLLTVQFDERIVEYDFSLLDELTLAYAITVHKSQGSEFDIVVMPVADIYSGLMNRNILYTAVTRAKSLVVLVGREDALARYVNNISGQKRYSGLTHKLCL